MGGTVVVGAGDDGAGTVAELVAAVDAALDGLRAVSFTDLPLEDQAVAVVQVARLRSRLEGVEARVLAAFDAGGGWGVEGHRSAIHAVAHGCRLSRAEARRRLRLARRLRATPVVTDALAKGDITGEQARLLVAARRDEVTPEFERDEALLVDQARRLSPSDLATVLRYWSHKVDPRGAQDRADRVEQSARAFVSRTIDDLVRVDAWLDPIGGSAFLTAVQRVEDELFRADWSEAVAVHGDDTTTAHMARTPAQRRAAALVELAARAIATPPDAQRPRPLVNVLVDAATFDAALRFRAGVPAATVPPRQPVQCQLLDGPVITPAQAVEAALQGHVRRVVYDTPNTISQISVRRRFFTGTLRDLLEIRDRHCTHPGCDQPAWRCEGDHITPWDPEHPNTTPHNGRLLCRYHHRLRQRLQCPPSPISGPP